jgi:ribosomal protein uL23
MDPHKIIKYPLSTEKSIRLMESDNKLVFVVDEKAKKIEIKEAVEELFNVSVDNVKIFNTSKNQKRAYIRFSEKNPAIDIATQLGLM